MQIVFSLVSHYYLAIFYIFPVRQKIVELCGDMPRIELFARGSSKLENGWVKVGNEIDGCDIKASLDKVIRGTYLLDESLKTE